MKKIALTQRLIENSSYYEVREALDVKWGEMASVLNFCPIILPLCYNFEEIFKNIQVDGVILTGGNNLNSLENSEVSKKRDSFEMKLIEYCIKRSIPVLGVCRGMQIISEYFGASFLPVKNHIGVKHSLVVNHESKYAKELKKIHKVNSYHDFAVDQLSSDFLFSAKSSDGVIKAIEHIKYKIFAHMWHPERETPFIDEQLQLIEKFFKLDK
jgi:N5-(cytidine 5'-diphosphoramidyl)-L-glutamine hydrolase